MTARNFGIKRDRASLGGMSTGAAAHSANTRADPYPIPAQSLRPDPLSDADRSNIAGRFAVAVISFCFITPLVVAWLMVRFG